MADDDIKHDLIESTSPFRKGNKIDLTWEFLTDSRKKSEESERQHHDNFATFLV
ncbi:hypothetical protein V7S43_013636 [Phytophthora oleae]|uniref:Uncharacterized protein n=1 Tax=Phytophthora oleae TaxID=2107226 RepID=A0ABD3F3Y2_9STRA